MSSEEYKTSAAKQVEIVNSMNAYWQELRAREQQKELEAKIAEAEARLNGAATNGAKPAEPTPANGAVPAWLAGTLGALAGAAPTLQALAKAAAVAAPHVAKAAAAYGETGDLSKAAQVGVDSYTTTKKQDGIKQASQAAQAKIHEVLPITKSDAAANVKRFGPLFGGVVTGFQEAAAQKFADWATIAEVTAHVVTKTPIPDELKKRGQETLARRRAGSPVPDAQPAVKPDAASGAKKVDAAPAKPAEAPRRGLFSGFGGRGGRK